MKLPTNAAEWDKECERIVRAMQGYAAPCITPISKIISDDEGKSLGTGSYIEDQFAGGCSSLMSTMSLSCRQTHSAYNFTATMGSTRGHDKIFPKEHAAFINERQRLRI